MIGILKRHEGVQLLERLCTWITSGKNRLYIGWFSCLIFSINSKRGDFYGICAE